jgi:uncharacterized protein involved in outer membrane biogenesis
LKWTGVGFGVLTASLVAFIFLMDWNWVRDMANTRGSAALGRDFAIEGDLKVDLRWPQTHVRAEKIRVGNAKWASDPNMVEIEVVDLQIRLPELLRGRLVLPELQLVKPKVALEKADAERKNWDFSAASPGGAAVKATVPQERSDFPVIGQLTVEDGELKYVDTPGRLQIHSKISTAVGEADKESTLKLQSRGTVQDEAFTVDLEGGSVLALRENDKPYPVRVNLRAGRTIFAAQGTLTDPLQMTGIDLQLRVEGDSLSKIFNFTGIPLPPTPPYRIEGHLGREGEVWSFENFQGRVGDSDLAGNLHYDGGKERALIAADLNSRLLQFKDLAGFIGAGTEDEKPDAEPRDRVLPEVPLNLERLRAADLDVNLRAQKIVAPNVPFESMDSHFKLENGRLVIQPLKVGMADGSIEGVLILDGRSNMPRVETDLTLRRLGLRRFFEGTRFESLSEGRLGGRVQVAGNGHTLAEVLGSGDGRITTVIAGGKISVLMIHATGIDVAKVATSLLGTDKPTELRCAVIDSRLEKGVLYSEVFEIDTAEASVDGHANIDFRAEGLDIRLLGHPKKPTPFVARSPITVTGTMKSPQVGIDATGLVAQGVAAAALAALNPIAAIIPFIGLGTGENSDCAGLLERARAQGAPVDK